MLLNHLYLTLCAVLLSVSTVFATPTDFFTDLSTTRFQLAAPFAKMAEVKSNEPNFLEIKKHEFAGTLSILKDGVEIKIPVEINIKGFSSMAMCDFPKLELKIENHKNTIFAGNKKIDLNTHCNDPEIETPELAYGFYKSMFNAHREVAVYKSLELLGVQSFKTKAVVMKYIDSETGKAPKAAWRDNYQAFFIEDKSTFVKRGGYTEILGVNDPFKLLDLTKKKTTEAQYLFFSVGENSSRFDLVQLATIELFQGLVVNNDYFIKASTIDQRAVGGLAGGSKEELWNVKLFADSNGKWITVPQDFSLSLVSYAEIIQPQTEQYPFPSKYIDQLSDAQKLALKSIFTTKRPAIMKLIESLNNDPLFEKIHSLVSARYEILIQKLEN